MLYTSKQLDKHIWRKILFRWTEWELRKCGTNYYFLSNDINIIGATPTDWDLKGYMYSYWIQDEWCAPSANITILWYSKEIDWVTYTEDRIGAFTVKEATTLAGQNKTIKELLNVWGSLTF